VLVQVDFFVFFWTSYLSRTEYGVCQEILIEKLGLLSEEQKKTRGSSKAVTNCLFLLLKFGFIHGSLKTGISPTQSHLFFLDFTHLH